MNQLKIFILKEDGGPEFDYQEFIQFILIGPTNYTIEELRKVYLGRIIKRKAAVISAGDRWKSPKLIDFSNWLCKNKGFKKIENWEEWVV